MGAWHAPSGVRIQTPTGTSYLITATKRSLGIRFRRYLKVLRWPKDEVPSGAKVHPLRWYGRKKKSSRRHAVTHTKRNEAQTCPS